MSRVIKFRAWDGGRMVNWENINLADYIDFSARANTLQLEVDGQLMQFTGLLDKNGKEIYDGDIIKSSDCLPEDTGVFKIQFLNTNSELGFSLICKGEGEWIKCRLCAGEVSALNIEVIGNIYQNPELFKH